MLQPGAVRDHRELCACPAHNIGQALSIGCRGDGDDFEAVAMPLDRIAIFRVTSALVAGPRR
jgi:hypothetical protein